MLQEEVDRALLHFAQTARLVVAIQYLREKRLLIGQAARLAGLTHPQFLDRLAVRGIHAFDLSAADARSEIVVAWRATARERQSLVLYRPFVYA